jgi:hypothetical protein
MAGLAWIYPPRPLSSFRREPYPACYRAGKAMTDGPTESEVRRQYFRELLLGYLTAVKYPAWPGSDGQTVEEVLCCYPLAASAGRVPTREQLLHAHPGLAGDIDAIFRPTRCVLASCHNSPSR